MTLEKICQQKDEKLIEIRASKQRITETARQIFRPNESESKANTLMDNFNSGVAIFNGIMTGFKIIKRIRNYFYH
ncbi:MAG: hypothetical protein IKU64_03610 [Bacteroides sp.]|nr:hypothetical protein [Bacteroides sp.]